MNQLNLNKGEHILYEFSGKLIHTVQKIKTGNQSKVLGLGDVIQFSMQYGKISITNNRVIAQGDIKVTGMDTPSISGGYKGDTIRTELYKISINNIDKIRKIRNGIAFEVKGDKLPGSVSIKLHETSQDKLEENKDKLFELLSEVKEKKIRKRRGKRKKEIGKNLILFICISLVTGIIGLIVGLIIGGWGWGGWGFLIGLAAPWIIYYFLIEMDIL